MVVVVFSSLMQCTYNNNEYRQKRIVHNEICSHIFMSFLFMHSYFYFLHLEFTIHIILIPQTQKDVCFLLPFRKKITTK